MVRHNKYSHFGIGRALGLSLLAHGMLLLLLSGANWFGQPRQHPLPGPIIQATLVDIQPLLDRRQRIRDLAETARREAQRKRQQKVAADKRTQQKKQQRKIAEQRKHEAESAARQRRERDRLEAARRAQAEQQRQLDELRREGEKIDREARAAEQKLAELRKQQKQEHKARSQRLEEERRKQLLAADTRREKSDSLATKRDEYMLTIRMTVTRNWLRPPTARPGVRCVVSVHQIPGGEVVSADVTAPCNADSATRQSIVNAVRRSSPLPYHGYENVFERRVRFNFKYDG